MSRGVREMLVRQRTQILIDTGKLVGDGHGSLSTGSALANLAMAASVSLDRTRDRRHANYHP